MEIEYSLPTKILSSISIGFLILAILITLLPTIKADVIETKSALLGGNGYNGIPRRGAGSVKGPGMLFSTYEFRLDNHYYDGWGLAEKYDGSTVEIKYLPLKPSITFSSSIPYLFFSFFFMLLAVGVRNIVTWATKILIKNAS